MDLLESIDKYLTHADLIDTVNKIGIMDMDEIVEYIANGGDKEMILSNLDKGLMREQVEQLINGGIL